MLRPSRPMRRSINGQQRKSSNTQCVQGSLLSRRISCNSQVALTCSAAASDAGRAATAPPGPSACPNAVAKFSTPPPSSGYCAAESYNGDDDVRRLPPAQWLTSSCPGTTADFIDGVATAAAAATTVNNADPVGGRSEQPSSAPTVSRPQYSCLNGILEDIDRQPCMPKTAQRLFTSAEIVTLRSEARRVYTSKLKIEEQKNLFAEEAVARSLLAEAALGQIAAIRDLAKEAYDFRMQAASAAALPFLYLEERINRRVTQEYAQREKQLRQEGREAWRLQVMREEAAAEEASRREVERRAETNRFGAAVTFIIVQEAKVRKCLEDQIANFWEVFAQEEANGQAEAERLALERFNNSPEQRAIREARERREQKQARRTAKLLKLFENQQKGFVKGCRHGTGGVSLFVGDAAAKICRRCRVKWDADLGYYVSLDFAVKMHPPPPPPPPSSTTLTGTDVKKVSPASKQSPAEVAKNVGVLPPLKGASK
ncbi:hypothetical protein JKF63_04207 [Porcisia hertigi]|uniref:Uncharacterized protein n=1 Tax=Porcisia hertigi TaxID=2761500 RepID=A0A836L9P4_9TRYP|nr:hypothetical protein JKF63_04207 [Porcisia hertigi]